MKKFVMALAVAGAAVCAQAASVKWDSSKMFTAASADGGFSSTAIKGAATGYLFALTESDYNTLLADYAANGNMSAVWNTYKDSLGTATGTGATKAFTSVSAITTTADVGDTVYGAIIYTYTDATLGKDFYIANLASGTVGAESGLTLANLGTYFKGDASGTPTGGWVATPEPTSGLLLLLGAAGLALRRKRG